MGEYGVMSEYLQPHNEILNNSNLYERTCN